MQNLERAEEPNLPSTIANARTFWSEGGKTRQGIAQDFEEVLSKNNKTNNNTLVNKLTVRLIWLFLLFVVLLSLVFFAYAHRAAIGNVYEQTNATDFVGRMYDGATVAISDKAEQWIAPVLRGASVTATQWYDNVPAVGTVGTVTIFAICAKL